MAITPNNQKDVSRQSSARRPRAPTITIDTSAVNVADNTNESQPHSFASPPNAPSIDATIEQGDATHPEPSNLSSDGRPGELRPAQSFDSKESRPVSPHNVSSPSTNWSPRPDNFLAVPNTRSRVNSVDSAEEFSQSPTSYGGETCIPSVYSSQISESQRRGTIHDHEELVPDEEALRPDPGDEADFWVENNPFAFSPGQLNKLLNPKSPSAFRALGGLRGLEIGLRTDRQTGLSVDEDTLPGSVSFEDATGKSSADSKATLHVHEGPHAAHGPSTSQHHPHTHTDRIRVFADNKLPEKKAKSFLELAWLAYNDKVLILLTIAAVVSLAIGIYQSVSPPPAEANEPRVEWVEGVAIIVAIVIVVFVGAANDWQKERQFVKLNKKKEDRMVKVVRSGKSKEISVHDLLVGDVVHIEPGDMIPADGVFISGHNLLCDESSVTGESDLLRKTGGNRVYQAIESHESLHKLDPFIISGAKVNEGVGTYLVTSTGIHSSHGKTMLSLQETPQTTPLQVKLNVLAEYIAKLGLGAGLLLFIVTFIEFCVRLNQYPDGPTKGQAFVNVFIVAVTIVVVAVPEGLPLAVTLALAFATTRMLKDNNLVRLLRACETMGNATTICSDKTGTLTQNKMTVVAGTIGTWCGFGGMAQPEDASNDGPEETTTSKHNVKSAGELVATLCSDVRDLLRESIVVNSTAFEADGKGDEAFIGSKTETALLLFCRDHLGLGSLAEDRAASEVIQVVPFDSGRKCMATVVKTPDNCYRMYVKGASEILLSRSVCTIRDPTKDLGEMPLSDEDIEHLSESIETYASRSLRTIGVVYRDFDQWPPRNIPTTPEDPKQIDFDSAFGQMTFLGVVGIHDPLREGVTQAVRDCKNAGVVVRMVTGDNLTTARAIATDCGIYTAGGVIMEGPQFRRMNATQMRQTIPRLQVLARSSPEDKRTLVKRLREIGETVAVTGDGTNDAPALRTADVGFSMGIAGTEVAKEASAIILMDDNFASIVKAMMWGRAVNDAVKKFLQFQVTVNITAVVLTFISAVSSKSETSVLTAVQLLWVNLIMDTFAALALATDPPTPSILDRKPEPRSAPLISLTMWKMIIGQSIYQLAITLALYFAGPHLPSIFPSFLNPADEDNYDFTTTVFNTFVWMQIFNQYNCRRIDNKLNILDGVLRNRFFIAIQVIIVAGQVLIVFKGGAAFSVNTGGIDGVQWGICLVLGFLSVPIGMLIRFIPDSLVQRMIPDFLRRKKLPEVFVSDEAQHFEWDPALEEIKADLAFLKMVRGGRLNMLKYKIQHARDLLPRSRSGTPSRSAASSVPGTPLPQTPTSDRPSDLGSPFSRPPLTPDSSHPSVGRKRGRSRSNSALSPAAAMAGIVAGSIGGWHPLERRDGGIEFASRTPMQDRSDIEGFNGVEIHPATQPDDPVVVAPEALGNVPPSQNKELRPASQGATLGVPESSHETSSKNAKKDME